MYCIKSTIVERLKEQDLNIDDLLREYVKEYVKKQKIEVPRQIVEDENFITTFFNDRIEIVRK